MTKIKWRIWGKAWYPRKKTLLRSSSQGPHGVSVWSIWEIDLCHDKTRLSRPDTGIKEVTPYLSLRDELSGIYCECLEKNNHVSRGLRAHKIYSISHSYGQVMGCFLGNLPCYNETTTPVLQQPRPPTGSCIHLPIPQWVIKSCWLSQWDVQTLGWVMCCVQHTYIKSCLVCIYRHPRNMHMVHGSLCFVVVWCG